MVRVHNGGVVGFCLGDVYIETVMSIKELDDLIKYLINMGRKIKSINKTLLWRQTIATISVFNIMNSPECYDKTGKHFDSCKWHWDTLLFIKREFGGDGV